MDKLLSVQEVAKYLGYTQRTIYNMIDRGEIPCIKIGKEYRFRQSDINDWIDAKATKKNGLEKLNTIEDPFKKRLVFMGLLTRELKKQDVQPIIVGGQAVEFYTAGGYATYDIDIVAPSEAVDKVLSGWSFKKQGRYWVSENLEISIEAPAFGLNDDQLEKITELEIDNLKVYIIGIEDIILDRLNAYVYWSSKDDITWAKEMALNNIDEIDWKYLQNRADEKITKEVKKLKKEIGSCEKD